MMVITKKQLKKFNERFCEANLSEDGEKVLVEVMQILGLRHTRVDYVKCIAPLLENEMYWSHASRCVRNFISDMKAMIARHNNELEEMERGINPNDENRRRNLLNANDFCRETVKNELRYLKNIEED